MWLVSKDILGHICIGASNSTFNTHPIVRHSKVKIQQRGLNGMMVLFEVSQMMMDPNVRWPVLFEAGQLYTLYELMGHETEDVWYFTKNKNVLVSIDWQIRKNTVREAEANEFRHGRACYLYWVWQARHMQFLSISNCKSIHGVMGYYNEKSSSTWSSTLGRTFPVIIQASHIFQQHLQFVT